MSKEPTQEIIKKYLDYNPDTGIFTWKEARGNRGVKPNRIAGCKDQGYVDIRLLQQNYRAHRLAWVYMTGNPAPEYVDHINRNRSDNRWENLRAATACESARNVRMSPRNTVGLKGVTKKKNRNKYVAQIKYKRKRIYLGTFNTPEEAHAAYCVAAKKYHGDFACLG